VQMAPEPSSKEYGIVWVSLAYPFPWIVRLWLRSDGMVDPYDYGMSTTQRNSVYYKAIPIPFGWWYFLQWIPLFWHPLEGMGRYGCGRLMGGASRRFEMRA